MNIDIKVDRDFENTMKELEVKYGEDFMTLNGFHPSQLNMSDFIDGFIDKNVADATIDSNANASIKDIRSLMSEKGKSLDKLFCFNKLFIEMKKKYGLATAKAWLESEYNGLFYMHDAHTSTFLPYCFSGDTKIHTDEGLKRLDELVDKKIKVINRYNGWEDATVKHFGQQELYELTLERYGKTKTVRVTGNHRWFVCEGASNKTVEKMTVELKAGMKIPFKTTAQWSKTSISPFGVAHGFFIGDGDKGAHKRANFCGDKSALIPYFTPNKVSGDEREYVVGGIPNYFCELPKITESKSYLYGWLAGYFAADGCIDEHGRCTLSSCNLEYIEFARDVLCVLGMPVNQIRYQDRVSNLTGELGRVYILTLSSEYLSDDFFIRPTHRARHEMYNSADKVRHRRDWCVKSVIATGEVDDVYCAVTESSQSFVLEGNILTHNCYAFDLTRLATEGLFFLENYNHQAPKHLTTFLDDVIEYVSYMSNRSSGAVGLPNILIWTYYFWKKDCEDGYYMKSHDYYMRQCFQKLIYRLNQPFLRVSQSAFVNVSIFDREYIKSLFGGVIYPDGSLVVDQIDEIIAHQKTFMEVVSEIRNDSVFTFPVLTYSLLYKDGRFIDEEFARWCSDHNMKWNDSNFFISGDVGVLSNCCFDGSQMVLTKSSEGVHYMSFRDLYKSGHKHNFTIFHDGSWARGKLVRLPKKEMFRVRTSNNKEILVTCDHLNPTLRGDVRTDKLSTDDYLLFNTSQLDVVTEVNKHLTYEQGFLIGMYLGDGSIYCKENSNHTPTISLSLNKEKYELSIEMLNSACKSIDQSATVTLNKPYNNVYPVVIRNSAVASFIRSFVLGNYCFEKSLNMDCLLQSAEFRKGILDGYYLTDGGNSNRIYTTSRDMVGCMEALITSLGMNTIINVSDRTGEGDVVIRGQKFNRNYPLYCIRWYGSCNRRRLKDVYIKRLGGMYFKIVSIERYETDDEYVYCFEMDNEDEPYFTLPNGIITHNCRLLSDTSKLTAFINSIGGTALSIGSVKVNTINLMRIAYDTKFDQEKYLRALESATTLCCKILDVQRHVIQRNVEKKLLPNYADGGVEMDKQYSTVGILGLFEVIESFGMTKTDEFGYVSYTDEGIEFASRIFEIINRVKDSFTSDYSFNIESVPAERAAVILCQKDNTLYGRKDKFIYSNQWIPLSSKCTISEKLRLSSILDAKCSGGAIAHINLESNFTNSETAWNMLNKIAQSGVMYFAFNTKINECKNHHGFVGVDRCPHCGEPVYDTLQRIVGYITPSRSYSSSRLAEFNSRKWYEHAELLND